MAHKIVFKLKDDYNAEGILKVLNHRKQVIENDIVEFSNNRDKSDIGALKQHLIKKYGRDNVKLHLL